MLLSTDCYSQLRQRNAEQQCESKQHETSLVGRSEEHMNGASGKGTVFVPWS